MPFRRARTVDELFSLCEPHDLVLTADAPLAQALNRRLNEPRLGAFATTPKTLARRGMELDGERGLFHRVVRETDLPWKAAARTLGLVLEAWEETGRVEALLEHPRFDTGEARAVVEVVREAPSTHRARELERVDDDRSVAVVGERDLSALDRAVLPEDYQVVEPLADGDVHTLEPMRRFPSVAQVLGALEDHVTPEVAESVAIVVEPGTSMSRSVQALLEARGIPYGRQEVLGEDADLRALLRVLRLAWSRSRLRVRDVRPVLAELGVRVQTRHDKRHVSVLEPWQRRELEAFWDQVPRATLGEALGAFSDWTERDLSRVRHLVDELGALDEPVDLGLLDGLSFYLDTYDVQVERETEGVLLASPLATATVDRPAVFYLGLDTGWSEPVPERPWIDVEDRERRSLERFERLLQNGSVRGYLVTDTVRGKPVTPCFHFHELLGRPIEAFAELEDSTVHATPAPAPRRPFQRQPVPEAGEPEPVTTFSASGLDRFVFCPRDLYFRRVVFSPDQPHFERGNVFHEFAEACVQHPSLPSGAEMATCVERALEDLAPFHDEEDLAVLRTDLTVGFGLIVDFLRANPPQLDGPLDGYEQGDHGNRFCEVLELPREAPITEVTFKDPDLGLSGKLDLIVGPDHILDHKSSKSKPGSGALVRKASLLEVEDPVDERPTYQPAVYLAHHRRRCPDRPLRFTLFHFLSEQPRALKDELELHRLLRTVAYVPQPFQDHLADPACFTWLLEDAASDRAKVLDKLDAATFAAFWTPQRRARFQGDQGAVVEALVDDLHAVAVEACGDYKYARKGAEDILKALVRRRESAFFEDDLDAFEAFVSDQLERLNGYLDGRFPATCTDLSKTDNPDLILEVL